MGKLAKFMILIGFATCILAWMLTIARDEERMQRLLEVVLMQDALIEQQGRVISCMEY